MRGLTIRYTDHRADCKQSVKASKDLHIDTVLNQQAHHGKTEIFSYVFGHIDQLALGGGDQDEAVQRLEKGLVRQRAVWSLSSRESLEREEWKCEFSFGYTVCVSAGCRGFYVWFSPCGTEKT